MSGDHQGITLTGVQPRAEHHCFAGGRGRAQARHIAPGDVVQHPGQGVAALLPQRDRGEEEGL